MACEGPLKQYDLTSLSGPGHKIEDGPSCELQIHEQLLRAMPTHKTTCQNLRKHTLR